jgi:hypothetical protein
LQKILSHIFLLVILFFLSTCKKYPENNLWFRKPDRIIEGHWHLKKFAVNGFDSTGFDDVRMYTEKGFEFLEGSIIFSEQYQGGYQLANKKKSLSIGAFESVSPVFYSKQKNIFRDNLTWKILKLSRKELWLNVNNKDKNYEIHLEN